MKVLILRVIVWEYFTSVWAGVCVCVRTPPCPRKKINCVSIISTRTAQVCVWVHFVWARERKKKCLSCSIYVPLKWLTIIFVLISRDNSPPCFLWCILVWYAPYHQTAQWRLVALEIGCLTDCVWRHLITGHTLVELASVKLWENEWENAILHVRVFYLGNVWERAFQYDV